MILGSFRQFATVAYDWRKINPAAPKKFYEGKWMKENILTNPDNDKLSFQWWQYQESGSYKGTVKIQNADQSQAQFAVPQDAKSGQTVHLICAVTDDGAPPLTRYRRVIVEFGP